VAVQDIGLSILTSHGVDNALYEEMNERTEEFFATTSMEDKLRFRAARHGSISQGYFLMRETSDIHPDRVEGWVWCRRAFDLPQNREENLHRNILAKYQIRTSFSRTRTRA
jgi:isopenicillin N synthase-like dioxygenase